jgi:hypothetical protein
MGTSQTKTPRCCGFLNSALVVHRKGFREGGGGDNRNIPEKSRRDLFYHRISRKIPVRRGACGLFLPFSDPFPPFGRGHDPAGRGNFPGICMGGRDGPPDGSCGFNTEATKKTKRRSSWWPLFAVCKNDSHEEAKDCGNQNSTRQPRIPPSCFRGHADGVASFE